MGDPRFRGALRVTIHDHTVPGMEVTGHGLTQAQVNRLIQQWSDERLPIKVTVAEDAAWAPTEKPR